MIADERAAGSLRSVWRKAAAIEMEAAGVASVLWHMENPPRFLVIKSVCDYADARKDDDWQVYAADTAASCAFSFAIDHLTSSDIAEGAPRTEQPKGVERLPNRALRESLQIAYSTSDLKVLCSDINVDWDEIPPGPKSAMIVELLHYVRRRGLLGELVAAVNRDRNNILSAYGEAS